MKSTVSQKKFWKSGRKLTGLLFTGVLALCLQGCPLEDFLRALTNNNPEVGIVRRRLNLSVIPDHAAVGTTVSVGVSWIPNDIGRGSVSVARADGQPMEGVTIDRISGNDASVFTVDLTIAPNAPTAPLFIYGNSTGRVGDGSERDFADSGRRAFYIHAANATDSPRLATMTPNTLRAGETATVTLTGQGFDASIEPVITSPGIEVSSFTTASPTEAHAVLIIADNARTGSIPFAVRTAAGTSAPLELFIESPEDELTITSFYPNHLESGTRLGITAVGRNFATGQSITCNFPESLHITKPFVPRDPFSSTFEVSAERSAQGLFLLTFGSLHGEFGPAGFRVLRPEVRGPRLFAIRNSPNVIIGAETQLVLETNERVEVDFDVESVPTQNGPTLAAASLYGYTEAGTNRRRFVAQVRAAPNAPVSPAYLGLRRGDGLTTDLVAYQLVPAPRPGMPFIRRTTPSFILRGQSQDVIIEGEALGQVRSIRCSSSGLSAVAGQVNTDGTSLRATFTADADAVLTGEDTTTFQLITTHGTSNPGCIVVTYATGQ